jgi:hypothetical protein
MAHSTEIEALEKVKEKDWNRIHLLRQARQDLKGDLEHSKAQLERQRSRDYRVTHLCIAANDAKLTAYESKAASEKQDNKSREAGVRSMLWILWAVYLHSNLRRNHRFQALLLVFQAEYNKHALTSNLLDISDGKALRLHQVVQQLKGELEESAAKVQTQEEKLHGSRASLSTIKAKFHTPLNNCRSYKSELTHWT